jgi:hypothetical protein
VQEHAERAADVPEHLEHMIDDVVVRGGHVGLSGDGGDSRHDEGLLSE